MAHPNSVTHRDFARAVFSPPGSVPDGVVGLGIGAPHKRFSVYQNSVASSLIEAMAANFPTVKYLVGDVPFSRIALAYLQAHPPESPVLIHLGARFAQFLKVFEPVEPMPHLTDIARVEYAWLQSYHAADLPVLDRALLKAVNPEQLANMTLSFHPAAWLFRSDWAGATMVAAVHSNSDFDETEIRNCEAILITRSDLDVEIRVLREPSFEFHSSLAKGNTLEQASNHACLVANGLGDKFDLATEISQLLHFGAFARSVSFEPQPKKI